MKYVYFNEILSSLIKQCLFHQHNVYFNQSMNIIESFSFFKTMSLHGIFIYNMSIHGN